MANEVGLPISIFVQMPKELEQVDYDRKAMMGALTEVGKKIRLTSRRLLNSKSVSKPGEVPGKVTGRMYRAVKVHKSKRKDRYWVRVQIDSFPDKHHWYPAALMYGSAKHNLKPREDALHLAGRKHEDESVNLIQNAMEKSLKGWF